MERPIAFHPQLARELGDIASAIYYQQLYYWKDKGKRDDGWVYKTKEEIEEETTLTRKQQDRIRKLLEEKGWIETKLIKANGAPTIHYRCLVMMNLIITKGTFRKVPKGLNREKYQRDDSITESTTESTTEKELSYESPPPISYKSKQKIANQKGIVLKRTPRTTKQEDTAAALYLMDYYRDRAHELHGFQFFKVKDESRNKKIRQLIIRAHSELKNKTKELIDWWLKEEGEWADYEPENCFTTRTIEKFINTKPKTNDINYKPHW